MQQLTYIVLLMCLLAVPLFGQQESPFAAYEIPTHNLLKFNRFLINPTFSTVREVKSYFNMQHRNQSISFEDNYRAYFLSYSGRIGDRSGVGLGVFNQREGLIDNYGALGNYAYGIRLTEHSNFTFAANIIYYNSGVNQNRANPIEADPTLLNLENSSLFSFQPGFNISYKKFDFGVFAENLFDYNLNTKESVTVFNEKTFTGHLQYTHTLKKGYGLLDNARILALARVRRVGNTDLIPGGNAILDLPNTGWLQVGYDDFYGASAGIGFNVAKRVSIGYTIEKGLSNNFENFGINHEISLAYAFVPTLTERMVMRKKQDKNLKKEQKQGELTQNNTLKEDELAKLKEQIEENDSIIEELLRSGGYTMGKPNTENQTAKDYDGKRGKDPKLEEANTLDQELKQQKTYVLTGQENQPQKNTDIKNSAKATTTSVGAVGGRAPQDRSTASTADPKVQPSAFIEVAESDILNIPGEKDGYYLVTNVSKSEEYTKAFMSGLERKGFEAHYFMNKRNGFKYVYLKHYKNMAEASKAFENKLDGTYEGDLWIVKIEQSKANSAEMIFEDELEFLDYRRY